MPLEEGGGKGELRVAREAVLQGGGAFLGGEEGEVGGCLLCGETMPVIGCSEV